MATAHCRHIVNFSDFGFRVYFGDAEWLVLVGLSVAPMTHGCLACRQQCCFGADDLHRERMLDAHRVYLVGERRRPCRLQSKVLAQLVPRAC